MPARAFPAIKPTSRSYSPGEYPQTVFEAQNGTTTVVRFGSRRVNAELSLGFDNITDANAAKFLDHYRNVNADWDYATFTTGDVAVGAGSSLADYIREVGGSKLRWRYSEPPSVSSVFPGRSSVRCAFRGFLDAD